MKTHKCPGLCGGVVPDHLLACRADWRRLPRELREAVTGSRRGTQQRRDAVSAAFSWYLDQAIAERMRRMLAGDRDSRLRG